MAARKLQAEIERVLKRVTEGVETFDNTYKKMESSTNVTQKEKLEADLKTQIKKLQRLRDQIKTWVAGSEIKDKSQLMEKRKLIETQMERFKACEKEMKTKAFSKEGLQASKLDPKAQEKLRITQWVSSKVEELQLQVEQAEAEIETLQGGAKKKKSGAANSRLEDLEHLNERRKWHISRLEIVLRLLDNGSLSTERVQDLQEDVSYFVESNGEENFDEDDGIYDELNLDEEEEKFGLVAEEADSDGDSEDESEDIPPRTPSKKQDEEPSNHKREEHSPILRKASVPLSTRKASSSEASTKPPPPLSTSSQPMSSVLKSGLPPRPPAALPVRYAAAAAAAVVNSSSATSIAASSTPSQSKPIQTAAAHSTNGQLPASSSTATQQSTHDAVSSSPSLTQASVSGPSPMLSSISGVMPDASTTFSPTESPAISESIPPSIDASHAASPPQRHEPLPEAVPSPVTVPSITNNEPPVPPIASAVDIVPPTTTRPQAPEDVAGSAPQQTLRKVSSPMPPASSQMPEQPQEQAPLSVPPPAPQRVATASPSGQQNGGNMSQSRATASAFPGSLSDLVASFENVKQKAPHRMNNLEQVHKLLDGGYQSMPQPLDTEKPKYYIPKNPYPTPLYYPQTVHPILSSPSLFANLDIETLFYVFYYLPGTYQQYLAAKELKRQSWRFHVKYLTWFQRHSEPQAITDEYEQGVYVYFDWEGSWCQRKKSDFRFEYRYLSED